VLVGYEIGDVGITFGDLATIEYDIKSDNTQINFRTDVRPEGWYTAYMPGRLVVYKYDEYYVCRDTGKVVSKTRTGNVKIQTDVLYIPQGIISVIDDYTAQKELLDKLRSNANVTVIKTYKLDPGQDLYLRRELPSFYSSTCKAQIEVGAPLGAVVELIKQVKNIKSNPVLLMPISFAADFTSQQRYESYLAVKNKGSVDGSTYNVAEFIDVYGIKAKIVASDGSVCQQYLPLTVIVAR